MTTFSELPTVTECSATSCSYNHDGCHAAAITISADHADCATFLPLGIDGGLPKVVASVGACQRTDCRFNVAAVCTAPAVRIDGGHGAAHCQTFEAA
jgi:hypothetical protein